MSPHDSWSIRTCRRGKARSEKIQNGRGSKEIRIDESNQGSWISASLVPPIGSTCSCWLSSCSLSMKTSNLYLHTMYGNIHYCLQLSSRMVSPHVPSTPSTPGSEVRISESDFGE